MGVDTLYMINWNPTPLWGHSGVTQYFLSFHFPLQWVKPRQKTFALPACGHIVSFLVPECFVQDSYTDLCVLQALSSSVCHWHRRPLVPRPENPLGLLFTQSCKICFFFCPVGSLHIPLSWYPSSVLKETFLYFILCVCTSQVKSCSFRCFCKSFFWLTSY